MSAEYFEGIGRRKRASARVRIFPGGSGNIIVNDKPVAEYFGRSSDEQAIRHILLETESVGSFDVTVKISGGGGTGQRDAIRLGLARALLKFNEELRPMLRTAGFLTRDSREKERKKPGLKRARKAPTYTKR